MIKFFHLRKNIDVLPINIPPHDSAGFWVTTIYSHMSDFWRVFSLRSSPSLQPFFVSSFFNTCICRISRYRRFLYIFSSGFSLFCNMMYEFVLYGIFFTKVVIFIIFSKIASILRGNRLDRIVCG